MAATGTSPLGRAEQFIWLTARVLEQRRFAHQYLEGGADAVETALTAYANEDGGYGHALDLSVATLGGLLIGVAVLSRLLPGPGSIRQAGK